jgi:hypothetical protein
LLTCSNTKKSTLTFSPASGNTTETGAFAKAMEKYVANNFSKGNAFPVKPITIIHSTSGSLDADWQEPITPRPKIVTTKREYTNRFVKPFPPQTPAMLGNASTANEISLRHEQQNVTVSSKDSMPPEIERRDIPQHKLKDPLAEKPQHFVRSTSSQSAALVDTSIPDLLVQRIVSLPTKDDMPLELHTIVTPGKKFMDFADNNVTTSSVETSQHSILPTANNVYASSNFTIAKAIVSSTSHVQSGDNKENASTSEQYTQVRGSTVTLPSLVQTPDKEIAATVLKAASIVSPQNDNVTVSTSRPVSQVSVTIKTNVEQPTDETSAVSSPLQATSKLGLALYALPKKDFSFKLENGKMVLIHKNVLAVQSSHFYQQFFESNDGSDSENVYDFDEEAVTLTVKACYQQHFDESILDDNVCEQLVKLATKYNIQCVMNLLPRYLSEEITEENVCSIAARACETNDSALRQKCATFIADFLPRLPGIENLPVEFIKEIIRAIPAKNKK